MADLTPSSDIDAGEWANELEGTSLFDHLAGGEFIHSRRRFRDGPQRILFITTDDGAGRYPVDYGAVITTCVDSSRVGTLARQNTDVSIIQRGLNFMVGRTDKPPCSPGRAAFMCGLRALQHGNTAVIAQEYYDFIRTGKRDQHVYDLDWKVRGPIEIDCNAIAAEAFFSDVNQSAAAWNSGTAYVVGDTVKQTIGGLDHFFKAQLNNTNKNPTTNCTSPADEWRHYGTLAAATAMRAQQSVDAGLQPFSGDMDGVTRRRLSFYGRLKGGLGIGAGLEDDLQATAGGWNHWLTYTGQCKCYGLEKHQNYIGVPNPTDSWSQYQSADPATWTYWAAGSHLAGDRVAYLGQFYVCSSNVTSSTPPPSDPTHWGSGVPAYTTARSASGWRRSVFSADDVQDHYRNTHIDFDELVGGPNPATGVSQIGVPGHLQYDYEILTGGGGLSYNSGTNKVTVVTQNPVPGLTVGEVLDISVDYSTAGVATPFGGTNWVEPEVSATCTDGTNTFVFTPTATPTGTPNVVSGFVYIRKYYETVWYTDQHIAMLDDVSPYDNIVVYHGFHNPHWSVIGTAGVRNDLNTMCERRYENSQYSSVPLSQAFNWQGVPGAAAPSVPSAEASDTSSTSNRRHWATRANMFASQDDAIGRLIAAWDAKFGAGNYYIILADDNGYMYGSHRDEEVDASAPVGSKVWTWESSVRCSIVCVGPEFTPNTQSTILAELADIPLTILDIMGKSIPSLLTHFAHDKRDGTSLLRKLTTPGGWRNHQFVRGKYLQGDPGGSGLGGESLKQPKIIDPDGNALARIWNGVIETGVAAAWVSGQAYTAGQQTIDAGAFYTCIVNTVSPHTTAPHSDATHWGNQGRRLFLGAGPGSGEPDPAEDETVDHSFDNPTTQALGDTLATLLSQLMVGRWEPATNTHTGKF